MLKCAHCRSSGAACCAGPGAASPCCWAVMPLAPGPPPATSHKLRFCILASVDTGLHLKLEQEVALCIRSASPQRCIMCQPRGCIKVPLSDFKVASRPEAQTVHRQSNMPGSRKPVP